MTMEFGNIDIYTILNGHKIANSDVISCLKDYLYWALYNFLDKSYYKNDRTLECYIYYPETFLEYVELKLNNIDEDIDIFKYIIIDQTRRVYLYDFIQDLVDKFNIETEKVQNEIKELIASTYPTVTQDIADSTVKVFKSIYESQCMICGKHPKYSILFKPLLERKIKKYKRICNNMTLYKHKFKNIYWLYNGGFNKWHPLDDLSLYL